MKSARFASDAPQAAGARPSYEIRSYRTTAQVFHWLTAALVLGMVALGVIAKQLDADPAASLIFGLHKLIGALTFVVVLLRLVYRFSGGVPKARVHQHRRPVLHWLLYGVVIIVPLLGWAGVSDFGGREIVPGFSLPPIWPEGAGYDELLLHAHAYFAFALLALIALHIGIAIQDYMTDVRSSAQRND
jgi:cytochrome b561